MSVRHPIPWRVGTKVARNIYDANNEGVMMADDEETAQEIVRAVNAFFELKKEVAKYQPYYDAYFK
ncbi:MAG TPA: hypothetical protein VM577_18775 [Anaerovoracaceae bacterium]|nr:hypothetical protein [Anaerovoracaceae bacterium]